MTPKQARFIDEYLVDLNATQAAIRAGYSAKTAEVQGCRLLRNAQIASEIRRRQQERAKEVGVTQEFVIAGLRENYERAMAAKLVTSADGSEAGLAVYNGS